jgi:predicted permease
MSAIPKEQLLSVPSLQHLTLDRTVLLFSLTLSVVTGMLFGLMPALQAFKTDMQQGLQEGGRSSVGSAHYRVRNTLVVVEVSLAVVLLAGAGLMLKSLHHLLDVDPGFRTENLLTVSVALPRDRYPDDAHLLAFHKQLLQNTVTLPGVRDAATVDIVPLSSSGNTSRFDIEGHPKASGGPEFEANSRSISENYFGVMGIPLRDGRLFGSEDNLQSRHVVIVNQALVNLVFQNKNPIGKRINFTYSGEPDLWEVVGVVADENVGSLDQKATPVIYTSVSQEPQRYFSLALRTTGDPKALVSSVRQRVTEIDPEVPAFAMASMKEIIASSPTILLHSYPAYLIATFAGLALLLAALGIYGLLTYSVAQRTRELGLRMALGAKQSDLLQLVVGNGLKLTVIGVLIGFVAALGILRLIASLLFGVGSADPATFIAVAGLIIASSTLASYLPARRASQIDPMIALRCE